ncbi:glucose-1-phosphate cytidylyltransferase [Chondromyces apiculatus]|uniref:Glucose-1-phosphate cytidylyltransferase n=1 Tax=Chondromyces apiculatus DSM 436 TaxID=1192034 RepID=A0A017SY87_9BACT|nr:glucose-1-phosphate cytidylyltransferase [Chondromyces apiculatus]EYF01928.1 Glucose-1-phosphate cytidylyltransferase [Chondromyces apiculatus DSM 436]
MKVVLLAGGFGSRLSEHTEARPKPMIEIGTYPILWHIMSIYASHGFNDFVVACGYKGEVIKDYFHSFYVRHSDYVVNLRDGTQQILRSEAPDWRIAVVDTGLNTMTGGRIRRLRSWLGDETFLVTYGDGVGNVNIRDLVAFHRAHGKLATVTAVRPPARFGGLALDGDRVREFSEKPQSGEGWINGGFFVFEPAVLDTIADDGTSLEREPLEKLAEEGQLAAYRHEGFWQPMDTLREKRLLESLWESGKAPWKTW